MITLFNISDLLTGCCENVLFNQTSGDVTDSNIDQLFGLYKINGTHNGVNVYKQLQARSAHFFKDLQKEFFSFWVLILKIVYKI